MKQPEIIRHGQPNGEGMVLQYTTRQGTNVFCLAIPNIHDDTDWDLGPTWCYLVSGSSQLLIDTGRFGNVAVLEDQLSAIDRQWSDIDAVITHGHEDHDGNLPDVLPLARAELWAHELYPTMISYFPDIADGECRPWLPGSCRSCAMPESFVEKNCAAYHTRRSRLRIDRPITEGASAPDGMRFLHTPGHSPDSICIILEDEVIFTGDTILPDITPHPSRADAFVANRRILPQAYGSANTVYGLCHYVKSLRHVAASHEGRFQATFPAHRLYYGGRFNLIHSARDRANAIVEFHIERCRAILDIVDSKPLDVDDIAERHFLPSQLKRHGRLMARNELLAHIEVMEECGDVVWVGEDGRLLQHTGTNRCLEAIREHLYSGE